VRTFIHRAALLALSFGLGACSIHPLPENVTGNNTSAIVRKIRCEARDAVIQTALRYLEREGFEYDESGLRALNLKKLPFKKRVQDNLKLFAQTGIVYSFTLQGTESGGLSTTADIVKPLTHGTGTLTPTLSNTLSRDNIRAFTISDNFRSLVQDVKDSYCNFDPPGPNYEYPITGRIGIDEMIKTFISLTLFGDLGGPQDVTKIGPPKALGPPTMVDTITFITTLSAGFTPKMVLSPVGKSWQLMDATFPLSAARTDKHAVIVGLALPAAQTSQPHAMNALTSLYITTSPNSSGEAVAAQAVAQQILRFQLPTPLIVAP
jgi:hypothetical protein